MRPDQRDLLVFHAVALQMNFTKAAESLNVSKGHVSKSISRLESQLKLKLFQRSTRRLVLTDAGERLLETTKEMQATLLDGLEALQGISGDPIGTLKVSAPPGLGEAVLAPMFAMFMQKYPEVNIDLVLESRLIDLIAEGYDVIFRSAELNDSSLVARKLLDVDYCLVAAPEIFSNYPEPSHPEDLKELPCIAYKTPGKLVWEFKQAKKNTHVDINPQLTCNLSSFLKTSVLNGAGVTVMPIFMVEDEIAEKKLRVLLPEWQLKSFQVYLVYPSRQHIPLKLRCFIDFVSAFNFKGL